MKIGERKYGSATAHVGFMEGVTPEMKKEIRYISQVQSFVKRQGHATELMNRIAADADRKKMILILSASAPEGGEGPTTEQLIEWYASLGYQELQPEPFLMVRMFNIPQIINAAERITQIIKEGTQ